LQDAAQANLAKANEISKIGYTPYYGPDVAALTPLQQAGMANTNMGASAFGMPTVSPMAGMPAAQTFANGMQGYSSGGLYDQALATLQARNPGQFAALNAPFINSVTGAQPGGVYGGSYGGGAGAGGGAKTPAPVGRSTEPLQGSASSRNTKFDTYSTKADTKDRAMSYGPQPKAKGYTGLKDMFDGGGAGSSRSGSSSGSSRSSSGRTSAPEPSSKYSASDRKGNSKSGGSSGKGRK
jgi:hypothetical protein